jgi:hypothetical protein
VEPPPVLLGPLLLTAGEEKLNLFRHILNPTGEGVGETTAADNA